MTDPAGAKLRTKDSRRISRLTAGYWKEVAAELDMDGEAIDNIAKSSSEYPEAKDKAFRMLEDLREQGCTKRKLADALRSLGKAAHADEVLPSQVRNSRPKISHSRSAVPLSFSLPRVIFQISPRPHHKYYITECEELDFS